MYFIVHILELVEELHLAGIIHGHLSLRSFVVLNLPYDKVTSPMPGTPEWYFRAPKLIDVARAIDTEAFPPGVRFQATSFGAISQQIKNDWSYEVRLF